MHAPTELYLSPYPFLLEKETLFRKKNLVYHFLKFAVLVISKMASVGDWQDEYSRKKTSGCVGRAS